MFCEVWMNYKNYCCLGDFVITVQSFGSHIWLQPLRLGLIEPPLLTVYIFMTKPLLWLTRQIKFLWVVTNGPAFACLNTNLWLRQWFVLNSSFKGTVAWDFLISVFFMNQHLIGHWWSLGHSFTFFREFAEIFVHEVWLSAYYLL